MFRAFLAALAAAALPFAAAANPGDTPEEDEIVVRDLYRAPDLDPRYEECLAGIDTDPAQGRAAALRWVTDGGGDPAVYCAAMADLAMDLPRVAARRLYALAEETRERDPGLAARLYAQSAQAWLAGDEPENALVPLEAAYALTPDALELHLMAAPVYAGAARWGQLKRVLDLAEAHTPLNANAYTLRAKAKQMLSDYEGAAQDVQRALNLDPQNIDALILRGELVQAGFSIDPMSAY